MPTGFTYEIEEGKITTLKDFAFLCARAFGACIDLRDEPLSAELPDKIDSNTEYYLEKIAESELELLPENLDEDNYIKFVEEQTAYHKAQIDKNIKILEQYNLLYVEIENWTPPTEDHYELKKFMINQIFDSRKHLLINYHEEELEKVRKITYDAWRADRIKQSRRDIEYYNEQIQKKASRDLQNTEWIQALKNSFT